MLIIHYINVCWEIHQIKIIQRRYIIAADENIEYRQHGMKSGFIKK